MSSLINYRPENFKKIKAYLDQAEELEAATQPAGTKNFVYTLKGNKRGMISLNDWEATIYCSPKLDEDIKFSELKKGLFTLTK